MLLPHDMDGLIVNSEEKNRIKKEMEKDGFYSEYNITINTFYDGRSMAIYKNNKLVHCEGWTHNLDLEETVFDRIKKHVD